VSNDVHPTAVLGPQVELGDGNVIGPFCVLQGPVLMGDGNFLSAHVSIGAAAEVRGHPLVPSWREPSDEGGVVIGSRNLFKEFVSVNTGWQDQTVVGDECMFMSKAYVAHDTVVGDRVNLAASVLVGGHTVVENDVTIGLGAALHQKIVVGAGAMIGMLAAVSRDLPPYVVSLGAPARPSRLNTYRLARLGVAEELYPQIHAVVLEGSRDAAGLPALLIPAIEAWWERQAATAQ
jgi:UDP-N-acetylglucosamine acyltransferase